jgi:hypothetical protein
MNTVKMNIIHLNSKSVNTFSLPNPKLKIRAMIILVCRMWLKIRQ